MLQRSGACLGPQKCKGVAKLQASPLKGSHLCSSHRLENISGPFLPNKTKSRATSVGTTTPLSFNAKVAIKISCSTLAARKDSMQPNASNYGWKGIGEDTCTVIPILRMIKCLLESVAVFGIGPTLD